MRRDGHDEANSRFSQFLRTRLKTMFQKLTKENVLTTKTPLQDFGLTLRVLKSIVFCCL